MIPIGLSLAAAGLVGWWLGWRGIGGMTAAQGRLLGRVLGRTGAVVLLIKGVLVMFGG